MGLLLIAGDQEVQKAIGVTDEQKGYLEILRDQVNEENEEFAKSIESLSEKNVSPRCAIGPRSEALRSKRI